MTVDLPPSEETGSESFVPIKSLRHRLIYGVKWTMAGSATVQLLGLAATYVLARILGKDGLGHYAIIQSSVGMFGIFAGMAMGTTAVKYVAEFRTHDPKRAGRFIGLPIVIGLFTSIIVVVITLMMAELIASRVLKAPELTAVLRLSVPLLILTTLANIQMGSLSGLEEFKDLAKCRAVIGVIRFSLLVTCVWFWQLAGAIIGLVFSEILACLILGIYLRANCRKHKITISYRGFRTEAHTLFHFSVPILLAGMILNPVTWLCNILLIHYGGGYGQMAIYHATFQWQRAVNFIPMRLLNVTLPVLSNLYGLKDFRRYYKTIKFGVLGIIGITVLVATPIIIVGKYIMAGYGEGFAEGYIVLIVMMAATILNMTARMLSQVAHSRSKAWWDLFFCSVCGITLISVWLLLLKHGALGLSISACIAYIIMNCGLLTYVLVTNRQDMKLNK